MQRAIGIFGVSERIIKLIKQKLVVPGNLPMDISQRRMEALRKQLETQLRPVLREKDYTEFDLERAIRTVIETARNL